MEKRIITIDFDYVIADSQKYQCDLARQMFNVELDITNSRGAQHVPEYLNKGQYEKLIDAVYSSTEIPIVEGFKEYLGKIQGLGYTPKIVTARDDKEAEVARKICEVNGINIPLSNTNYESKIKSCKGSIAHIDDNIELLKELDETLENLFLFNRPHNKHLREGYNIIRVSSWENIYEFLRVI